jgi:hypothetical protein
MSLCITLIGRPTALIEIDGFGLLTRSDLGAFPSECERSAHHV